MSLNRLPLDRTGPIHLEASREHSRPDVALLGVPYDGTTSNRPGARFGPDAIRVASVGLETWSQVQQKDVLDVALLDLGNLEVPHGDPAHVVARVREAAEVILGLGARPLLLGGEHSISSGAVAAVAERNPDLVVVQLDAHSDLRESYLGSPHNHACAMRRCLDHVGSDRLLQVGIRSGTREEWLEMTGTGRYVPPNAEALSEALARTGRAPIYLTVDLDVFDPASLPGTGTPEPGGIDWHGFSALLGAIPAERLIAADVTELAPQIDPTGCSAVLAAKVVREVILRLAG